MNKSDNLFTLIKSLTKNEKGYFKKYASFHTAGRTTNYVLLFDVIAKQTVYDENKVTERIRDAINPQHLSEVKNYLYEMILKSLDQYYNRGSVKVKLKRMLRFSEILYTKALYQQCKKILAKAEKIAVEFDEFAVLVEIYDRQSKIMIDTSFEGVKEKELEAMYKNEKHAKEKMRKEMDYRYLSLSLFYRIQQTGLVRSQAEVKKLDAFFINSSILQSEKQADSIKAKLYFYNTLAVYHFATQNIAQCMLYATKLCNFFEEVPELINDYFKHYLSGVNSLVSAQTRMCLYEEALVTLKKTEGITIISPQYEMLLFNLVYARKLLILLYACKFQEAVRLIPLIDEGMKKYSGKIRVSTVLTFHFNIACAYIILEEYRKAISRLNNIINNPVSNTAVDVQSFAHILNIIVHYEMKNIKNLQHTIRSTFYFLRKRKILFKFENIFIRFVKKLQKNSSETALKKLFIQFKKEICLLKDNPYEKKALDYFDFISWAESKIENRPMIDILMEKSLKVEKLEG